MMEIEAEEIKSLGVLKNGDIGFFNVQENHQSTFPLGPSASLFAICAQLYVSLSRTFGVEYIALLCGILCSNLSNFFGGKSVSSYLD